MPMNPQRRAALANYVESLVAEQKAEGFTLFTIGSDDNINMQDADEIVTALKSQFSSSAPPKEV